MKPNCKLLSWGFVALLVQAHLVLQAFADPAITKSADKKFDPSEDYTVQKIHGWGVWINNSLLEKEQALCQQTIALLQHQLFQIKRIVPQPALEKLQTIKIWVEIAEPNHACMAYHPDAGWLREHGMNPDKQGCVELANARNFLKWTIDQPWMVFHELAHAYHHQHLGGFENRDVLKTYRQAMQAELYHSVLRISGRTEKAYAMTNQMEYFAELSEAFFGTNDFYPYVRSELKEHDPEAFKMLERAWRAKP